MEDLVQTRHTRGTRRLLAILTAIALAMLTAVTTASPVQAADDYPEIYDPIIVLEPSGRVTVGLGETLVIDASKTYMDGGGKAEFMYFWDFEGDGGDGYYSPTYTFKSNEPGNHRVNLAVYATPANLDGPPTTADAHIDIQVGPYPTPEAVITPGGKQWVAQNSSITLTALNSKRFYGGFCTWFIDGIKVPSNYLNMTDCSDRDDSYELTYKPTKLGEHEVQLKIEDATGATDTTSIIVTSYRPRAPVNRFTPDANQTIQVPRSITFDASGSSAAGDAPLTYAWYVSGANAISGVASTSKTFTPKFTKPGSSIVRLLVTDRDGLSRGKSIRINTVTPCATPAADAKVTRGSSKTFDAKCWTNNPNLDFASLKYEWRSTGKPGVASTASTYTRRFDSTGRIGVELSAVDRFGQRSKVHRNMWVQPDAKPVASFTPARDTTVRVGTRVAFNGSASVDPDGGALTYKWYTTGIRGVVSKTNSYARTFTKAGKYRVQLVAYDDERNMATKTIEITVR